MASSANQEEFEDTKWVIRIRKHKKECDPYNDSAGEIPGLIITDSSGEIPGVLLTDWIGGCTSNYSLSRRPTNRRLFNVLSNGGRQLHQYQPNQKSPFTITY
jgi:hypothetical protein